MTRVNGIDLAAIDAIDFHVHAMRPDTAGIENEKARATREDQARRWKSELVNITLDETAQYYRERDMMAVVFTVDATTNSGHAPNSIDDIAARLR